MSPPRPALFVFPVSGGMGNACSRRPGNLKHVVSAVRVPISSMHDAQDLNEPKRTRILPHSCSLTFIPFFLSCPSLHSLTFTTSFRDLIASLHDAQDLNTPKRTRILPHSCSHFHSFLSVVSFPLFLRTWR